MKIKLKIRAIDRCSIPAFWRSDGVPSVGLPSLSEDMNTESPGNEDIGWGPESMMIVRSG